MTWWNHPKTKDLDGILCDGAVRSGKTMAITCGFFMWSMASFDRQVFALCGKTVGALRRNLILPMGDWLQGLFSVTEHRSENKLTVRLGNRVNTYYLFGGQDESAYTLIQGITLAGALLDEVALMPRSFVEQAAARCSVEGAKLWLSCNPASQEHWFYREWVEKAQKKHLLRLHFTMEDNPALSESVKERYRRLYTGVFYKRYILGQWCAAEGRIYDFDEERYVIARIEDPWQSVISDGEKRIPTAALQPRNNRKWYISVDYGTRNPFSAGLWQVENGVALRVREYYHDGRATGVLKTDEEYYAALEDLAGECPVERIIIDPSAASLIALIRRRGRFSVRKADNRVLPGIRLVGSLLQQGKLLFSGECKDAIREFSLYCWEDNDARDVPKKENDHAMDDIRYFCMNVMRRNQ